MRRIEKATGINHSSKKLSDFTISLVAKMFPKICTKLNKLWGRLYNIRTKTANHDIHAQNWVPLKREKVCHSLNWGGWVGGFLPEKLFSDMTISNVSKTHRSPFLFLWKNKMTLSRVFEWSLPIEKRRGDPPLICQKIWCWRRASIQILHKIPSWESVYSRELDWKS